MHLLMNSAIAAFLFIAVVHAFRMGGIEAEAFDILGRMATAIVLVNVVDYVMDKLPTNKRG